MINYFINALMYLYFPFTLLIIIYYIVVYETKQLTLLKMIVSELPVAQLSEDENFHEYLNDSNFRYSFFYFPLGIYKVYLLTWTKDKKFRLLKILSLKDICNQKIEDKEKKLQLLSDKSYEEYSKSSDIEKEQHLILLQDLIKQMQEIERTAQFKAMFYITTLAAILSVLVSKINDIEKIFTLNIYEQTTIALIVLYILNPLNKSKKSPYQLP